MFRVGKVGVFLIGLVVRKEGKNRREGKIKTKDGRRMIMYWRLSEFVKMGVGKLF